MLTRRATARMNLRLDPKLISWAKKYSKSKGGTLSSLIREYLVDLRRKTEEGHVEQF